jgi:NAD(P)-dependent dehydrogenase (short-subunit alcohol dehydrogenase family)
MMNTKHLALVTGANAGIGLETAAQLAEAGWERVILGCRSEAKAEAARLTLVERVGRDVFGVLVIDTAEVASAHAAADSLRARGEQLDLLVLNAGASSAAPRRNSDGIEMTYASTLVGHHVLPMRVLDDGLLSPNARIIIAGSEGARGNMPGMAVHPILDLADRLNGGDAVRTIEALLRLELPAQQPFVNMSEYVTAKLVVAWWAAAVARRLPSGITLNAVSPGGVADTSFGRDAPALMRWVMIPMLRRFGSFMGMNGTVSQAAARYLAAAALPDDATGRFYATADRKKVVGPVEVQTWPAFLQDSRGQEAALAALARICGL